ncbi:MAG: hypothetical protein WD708_10895 [Kiritimatiellia bacterium]
MTATFLAEAFLSAGAFGASGFVVVFFLALMCLSLLVDLFG